MNSKMILLPVVLLFMFISNCTGQHILESKPICKFDLNDKTLETFSEPSFINVRSHQLAIAISPCVHFKRIPNFSKTTRKLRMCNRNSRACVINDNSVINAGDRFIYTEIKEDGFEKEKVLMSLNGDVCQNDKNYKIIIHFNCRGIEPSYLPPFNDDESDPTANNCTFHIRMIASNCAPYCMVRVAGQYLSLKALANLPDIVVSTGDNKKAVFSMCRPSTACNANNSTVACEVQAGTSENGNVVKTAIGAASLEKVLWDEENQQIYLRSQINRSMRDKFITEIRLVCNWNEDSKARLVKRTTKMITFEVQSKFGCVKTAPKCEVTSSKGNYYDLKNLKTNAWFRDESDKKIYLSICGALKMPKNSNCQKSNSQVCDETGKLNFGTIMKPIKVDQSEYFLTTTFTGGSVCSQNSSQYYSTNIKFVCSLTNKEPMLVNDDKCALNILWETSEACPNYISSGKKCKVPNRYFKDGLLDLNGLHTDLDSSVSLSNTLELRYNLCGKLYKSCNNITEASMCLINNGRESVLGLENTEVIFENGIIRSYFYNSIDNDYAKPNVNVSFICNHNKASQRKVSVYSIEDKLSYQMTVESQFACSTNLVNDCTFTHENAVYDLTPLMKNDSNYELSSNQFKMQINICRPVLTSSQSLCDLNAFACLTNFTEPNLQKRYVSLGRSQNIFFDKSLTLKYTLGSLCPGSLSFYKETTILFSCSPDEETGPVLVESNNCNHTITWGTKFACPKKFPVQKRSETCLIKAADKILYNFTSLRKHNIELTLENNASLKLNICTGQYNLHYGETSYRYETANRTLKLGETNRYLQYDLRNNFSVYLNLQCDFNKTNEGFEIIPNVSADSKRIYTTLRSIAVCEKVIQSTELAKGVDVPEIEIKIAPQFTEVDYKKIPKINETTFPSKNNCFINSISTLDTFDLNSLPAFYVQSVKHSYYIDFNSTVNCKSYVCKDNIPLEQYSNLECPGYNLEGDIVKIKFELFNESACKEQALKGVDIHLECGDRENAAVVQESDCYVLINYQTLSICSFANMIFPLIIEEDNYKYKLGGIIAASVIVSIILVLTILRYLRKRRQTMLPPLCGGCQEFTSLVKQD